MASKTTKPTNVDTKAMEDMRQQVVEQELSARSWKAWYEKMYYSMECEKIQPSYLEYQERTRIKLEEERKKMEEFMAKLNTEVKDINDSNSLGELKIEQPEAVVVNMQSKTE